jgi:hypothetical protein
MIIYQYTFPLSLVQRSPTVCLIVCDQEIAKREAKGPSWTISAFEWKNEIPFLSDANAELQFRSRQRICYQDATLRMSTSCLTQFNVPEVGIDAVSAATESRRLDSNENSQD